MVRNYTGPNGAPPRFNEVFPWIVALDAFDHDDRRLLDILLRGPEIGPPRPIPEELRPALADIVAGRRVPNKKKAAKLKVPASERLKIAAVVSLGLGIVQSLKQPRALQDIEDRTGRPAEELMREMEADARHEIATTAAELGVSVETVENYLRDLRKKIENWPLV